MAIDITFLNNNSTANITTNFARVEAALEEALSRTGNTPNQMDADLDLNDYNIINVGEVLPGTISAANYVTYAEEWANKAEDSLVSLAAGGNTIDEYSAKHWAAKAEDSEAIAVAQGTAATASAAAALASENNASTSESNAASSASSASTSETNASTSESNASTSATNAATSETNAATSESNASTSETNAASSASSASTSETNAASSAISAAASYDQFDDRYLGAKATDPTVDNDGDALQTGALYFNTSTNSMRVYGVADWDDITTTVSRVMYEYTATSGQTVFTGVDREGNSLTTGGTFLNVHLNGLRLTPVDDYTYTGSSVTLAEGANVNDEVLIEALTTFDVANAVLITAQTLTDVEKGTVRGNIDAASSDDITRVENALGGFRNKIINGDFGIWQRATSQTSSGYGSADRWFNGNFGSTKTTSRQDFTVGQTDVPTDPKYFMRTVVTSVADAGNYAIFEQRMENLRQFAGKTFTLTFWAKADAAKNIGFDLYQHMGSGGSPSSGVTAIEAQLFALTTSWQKFSVTLDVPSISGKTLGTNGDDTLRTVFWLDAGSSYNARSASLGQQSGTFDIAHISLVEADATLEDDPSSPRHIQQELALCQRYYQELIYTGGQYNVPMSRFDNGTGVGYNVIELPVPFRDVPSFSQSGSWYATSGYAGVPILNAVSEKLLGIRGTNSTAASGCNYLTGGTITLDAEI